MPWQSRNKREEIIGTMLLLVYWVVVTPFVWFYDKFIRRNR